ncbi:RNA polymerase sigma factor [Microbacterium sp. QXD-8]|uniref:RNA polymerase sigma factor n=1 Tax=Microbacterium psychrotolerans TaxID=3068321 RepID=A0ABU0Z1T4_9MICO|nr:RNA polymerase sigma factor [Microbacterium sp. QXD-8]MDQ7878539.1 RNA polymerase sigma factor [Microbacterium sp. QXD-8]
MTDSPDSTATVESLFAAHYPSLVRFVFRRVGDRQLSEDLAAECYVRALGQSHRTTINAGWLYGTARNLIGDAYRRRDREQRLLQTLSTAVAESPETDHSALVDALAELTAHDRELLVMLHIDDLPPADVATALGVSLPTVWKRGSRARERLRTLLMRAGHRPSEGRVIPVEVE